jgi:hypothetical protein
MIGVLAGCLYLVDKAGMNAYCSGKKRESQLKGSGTNESREHDWGAGRMLVFG